MAVATSVLERTTSKPTEERSVYSPCMSADELHNAQIKENYRRLVDPDFYLNEDRGGSAVQSAARTEDAPAYTRPEESARTSEPYLVRGARADAEIFRADSAVNQRVATVAEMETTEEENEDLRPTPTTIQYRTVEDSAIERTSPRAQEKHGLGKREKMIIAAFVSIVAVLFVLVIVNSVIISNLNGNLAAVQQSIDTARGALAGVNNDIAALVNPDTIADFALTHGLVLR